MKFPGPTRAACVIVCLTAMLLGCGQKGPLVLPDAPKHKRTLPKTSAAPAPAGGEATASPAPAPAPATAPAAPAPSPAPANTPATPSP